MNDSRDALGRPARHALVLGAGVAGLVAARVLADHFDRVTIVDRDRLPDDATPRLGTPQSQHVHILLNSGRTILEGLFPELEADLAGADAPLVNSAKDLAWLTSAGWGVRFSSKLEGRPASRPFLEWSLRRQLRQHPRVAFQEGLGAVALRANEERTRVVGVSVQSRPGAGEAPKESDLSAALVVDATGRGSRAVQWLETLGYPEPPRTEINAFLGYTSRLYHVPDDPNRDWQGLYLQGKLPTMLRGGVLFRLEGGKWICTLAGYGKDYPPTDEDGYLAFARSLRSPLLYETIKDAEPLTPLVANRTSANVWHHFERLARWPDGFVVLGDAACAFNPVYGQGMSVAAKEAVILNDVLRDQRLRHPDGDLTGLGPRFQRRIAKTIQSVWAIATGEDVRVPGAEGGRPGRVARALQGYLDRVIELTTEDVFAREILLEVLNLDQPATRLFHPRLVAKVILGPTGRQASGPTLGARAVSV